MSNVCRTSVSYSNLFNWNTFPITQFLRMRLGGCFPNEKNFLFSPRPSLLSSKTGRKSVNFSISRRRAKRQTNEKKYYLVGLIYMHFGCLRMKRYRRFLTRLFALLGRGLYFGQLERQKRRRQARKAKLFTNAVNFVTVLVFIVFFFCCCERNRWGSQGTHLPPGIAFAATAAARVISVSGQVLCIVISESYLHVRVY